MMRKIVLLSFLFITSFDFSCLAQTADSEINLTKINTSLLESLFIKKLNQLRTDKKVGALTKDNILTSAAQDQATNTRKQ